MKQQPCSPPRVWFAAATVDGADAIALKAY